MSKAPLVSVILPSYNHAQFVTTAVTSVLDQTIRDLELIVVDDGSSDGTPDLVERIHDPRLRLIRLGQNRLRHPRNLAIGLAQGQYVAFQNSDDVWLPKKLESQMEVMTNREDVIACFTGVEIIDHTGQSMTDSWANHRFMSKNRSRQQWLRYFFEIGNCLCITSAMVPRSILDQTGGFKGSYVQLSDLELWVRLAAHGEFYILKEKLTYFRDTTGSTGAGGNLSSPNASAKNRSVLEYVALLGNYNIQPILDMLPQIFPEVISVEPQVKTIWLAQLAKYAWSLNTVHHTLFADNLISRIMDDETARNQVTDVFGVGIIQEFIKHRGNLKLLLTDGRSMPVTFKEKILNIILRYSSRRIIHPLRTLEIMARRLKYRIEKIFSH